MKFKNNLAFWSYYGVSMLLLAISAWLILRVSGIERIILLSLLISFYLWAGLVAWIDLKSKLIPLKVILPVIYLALGWHFFDQSPYRYESLLGLGTNFFMAMLGLSVGLLVTDLLTHFGNFIAKFPSTRQGILPLWFALPGMLLCLFFSESPVWLFPLLTLVLRIVYFLLLERADPPSWLNKLENLPWLAFLLVIGALIGGAVYTFNFTEPITLQAVVYSLGVSYLLEETILTNFAKPPPQQEQDQPSVIGGGDALLNAALGAWWGPFALVSSLQIAFMLAFIVVAALKILKKIKRDSLPFSQEMPFAPFILLGAQIGLTIALHQII
ncbi:MAG: hypothetical protein SFT81_02090 [Candidatus Caenarcaniphilales bacterium]|nr:hypothetical protein [Candidatus Caenarcaniphilales bacterium]